MAVSYFCKAQERHLYFPGICGEDLRGIIEVARESAYQAVNIALVQRSWLIGRRIAEEELCGEDRAEYALVFDFKYILSSQQIIT